MTRNSKLATLRGMPALAAPANLGIYAGVLLTAILLLLAYQVRPLYDITFGTTTDGVLLDGFNANEAAQADKSLHFRWSTGDSLVTLRDVGRQDFEAVLTVSGSRPPGLPPPSMKISAGGRTLLEADPPPQITSYSFHVPADLVEHGTLALRLTVNAFSPPGDERELGVQALRLQVSSSAATGAEGFVPPPAGLLAGVLGACALLGLGSALMGWGVGGVAVGASLPGLLAFGLLTLDRLWLTSRQWYGVWPQVVAAGLAFTLLVGGPGGWLLRRGGAGWSSGQRRALLTIMLAAFVVRLAGQLHPEIFIVDLGFHVHRLEAVQSGQLFFTTFASESGGRYNAYPPTAYLLMLPLQWLLNDRGLVIRLFMVGVSTLGVLPVFYLGKRALGSGRAGLLSSALYLSMPISVLPFSWGIATNLFGDFMSLVVLAILVGLYKALQPRRLGLWLLLPALFTAFLGHPAVVQLVGTATVLTLALMFVSRGTVPKKNTAWALGAVVVAAGVAYVVYYSHFSDTLTGNLADVGRSIGAQAGGGLHVKISGAVDDRSLGLIPEYAETRSQWLLGGLRGLAREAQAYYHSWPLAGALLGYVFVQSRRRKFAARGPRGRMLAAGGGWSLAVALFALVGLVFNLYVRYMLFALPVVALGAGALLRAVERRNRWGRLLALLVVLLFVVEALVLWGYRITYSLK